MGCYRQKKQNEFWNLKQKAGTVTEYDKAFNQLSRYAPMLVDIDEKRTEKFRNGLRHEIAISLDSGKGKRKWNEGTGGNPGNGHGKKPWAANQNKNQHQNQQPQAIAPPPCPNCRKPHLGECMKGTNVCYYCGELGHFASACPKKRGGAPQQQNPGNQQRQNQGPGGYQGQPRNARAYALNQHQAAGDQENLASTINVFDVSIIALFDTGASHSFILPTASKKLELTLQSSETTSEVRITDGGRLNAKDVTSVLFL
ncbi:uncharacterized protein LOC131013338 [Salvia miltiorrhiza]|uniref:uncharacterized protein LOC131013338 n=1 Tax=Salvia miltiorrhiza TaxID=226208 RepID=UPI0025ABE69D|nr:uncharacterized protein LOC131013338 [Salvia miltiorrhiza]